MQYFTKLMYARSIIYVSENNEKVELETYINSTGEKIASISIGEVMFTERYLDGQLVSEKSIMDEDLYDKYEQEISRARIIATTIDSGKRILSDIPNDKITIVTRLCAYDCIKDIYFYSYAETYEKVEGKMILTSSETHRQINQECIKTRNDVLNNTTQTTYDIINKSGTLSLPFHILHEKGEVATIGENILESSLSLKNILDCHPTNLEEYLMSFGGRKKNNKQ